MNFIESALEEEIKIVGRYANLQLGLKLFPNGDNTFDVCAYHYTQGDWMPLGDAEEDNTFASENEAIEHGINVIKEQTKYWDWVLSEDCTEENTKSAVRSFLGISSQTTPELNLFSVC